MKQVTRKSSLIFLLLSLLAFSFAANAQDAASAAKQITEFDVNGMKVIVKRRTGAPTVSAGLFFRGGSRNVTADNAGIESFTLNVASEGSKTFPRAVLRKELSRVGSSISAGSNYDFSALSLSSTKQNFDASWRMFVDVALNPTFVASDVERVREARLTSLRSANDAPESQLEELNSKVVYAGHPYSNSPDGTIPNLARFKSPDLAAYHKSLLQTSRMLLVVVGDVEPDGFRKRVEAAFAGLPRGNYKEVPMPSITFAKPSVDVESKQTETNYVKGSFAAPPLGSPDYYAMRAAISALATSVFQEVRVKRNLSYAPSAEMNSMAANTASISVSSVNPNEAVSVMLGEIKNLRERPLDAATLKELSGFFLTTHYIKQETNAAQAGELALYELLGGGWRNSFVFLDKVRNVTASEVQAAANKYMRNVRFTVVGNPADVDRTVFLKN
ncbi:MAG: pitrilysin family protein [Pyrinomonadaceae bacterium]